MERNKEDLTQGLRQRRKSQNSSQAHNMDNDSFGKPQTPLTTHVRPRPIRRLMIWSLGLVGVIAITTLAWLAGSGGGTEHG